MPAEIGDDERATELRESITATDREIVALVNRRLELVRELRDHKLERGYPMVDPGREDWLLAHLCETNDGALSDTGVRALAERVIELGKAEIYKLDGGQHD
jgi:chorismate mutase